MLLDLALLHRAPVGRLGVCCCFHKNAGGVRGGSQNCGRSFFFERTPLLEVTREADHARTVRTWHARRIRASLMLPTCCPPQAPGRRPWHLLADHRGRGGARISIRRTTAQGEGQRHCRRTHSSARSDDHRHGRAGGRARAALSGNKSQTETARTQAPPPRYPLTVCSAPPAWQKRGEGSADLVGAPGT